VYDAHEVLRLVDDHTVLVLLFGGLSFGCLFVYFIETARLGFRHRAAPMTLTAVAAFIAHDGNFVLNFDDWFDRYDHWLLQGFWLALVATTCFELVFFSLIVRHGREELAPRLSQPQFTGACVGALAAGIALWAVFKASVDDPLYLTTFMLTITWCLPSLTTLYLRRGVRRGISVRQLVAYWGMTLGYVLLTIVVFEFRSFWWIALCAVTLAWGAALAWAVSRAPAWEPEPDSAPRRSELDFAPGAPLESSLT
jgi:hypothetical protein